MLPTPSDITPALEAQASSVNEKARLHLLDITRGFAVMAILLLNIWVFGLP
ncbi:MAG: putative membrane protein YeiB [Paraglaciecola sp.]|jgi:uncharacterized membrane protein YeiB